LIHFVLFYGFVADPYYIAFYIANDGEASDAVVEKKDMTR